MRHACQWRLSRTLASFSSDHNLMAKAYISKHQSRTNLAYVATVCDDPALQKHMPHFIIGSKAKINNSHFASMQSSSRSNVHVWRNEHKAWNNSFLMQRMLQHIKDAVSHKKDVQICLIMDVAPCHIHESVMRKARSLGIMLVFACPDYVLVTASRHACFC